MDMIGKIRRLHARDKLSEREIARMLIHFQSWAILGGVHVET